MNRSLYRKGCQCACGGPKARAAARCRKCFGVSLQRGFSPQNAAVVRLFAECLSMKQIAAELGVSVKTVEWHLAKSRRQLKLPSLLHLVHWGLKHGGARFVV